MPPSSFQALQREGRLPLTPPEAPSSLHDFKHQRERGACPFIPSSLYASERQGEEGGAARQALKGWRAASRKPSRPQASKRAG